MEKAELIKVLSELIDNLYKKEEITTNDFEEIETDLNEISNYLEENKFYREILLLIKIARIAKGERQEHLKIAIISDLEKELRKLKLVE